MKSCGFTRKLLQLQRGLGQRPDPDRVPPAVGAPAEGGIKAPRPEQRLLLRPGGELRLAGLGGSQHQHHAAGASGSIAGPAGGKGGAGEPEPGLRGDPAAVK